MLQNEKDITELLVSERDRGRGTTWEAKQGGQQHDAREAAAAFPFRFQTRDSAPALRPERPRQPPGVPSNPENKKTLPPSA